MNVYLATDDFYGEFDEFFGGVKVIDIKNPPEDADLVVFTGGEDVSPYLYMDEEYALRIEHKTKYNPQRDKIEQTIFEYILKGTLPTTSILGICRGLQIINVFLGGTLFVDLPDAGMGHDMVHKIKYRIPLDSYEIKYVNSLHHQAVNEIGTYSMGVRFNPTIIAKEPETDIIEIMMWRCLDDKILESILGVQFHPEFFRNGADKDRIRNFITDWTLDHTFIGSI